MCRSIKTLRSDSATAPEEDVRAASLQFVRKVSGYRTPSRINAAPFDAAVEEVASAVHSLLASLNEIREERTRPNGSIARQPTSRAARLASPPMASNDSRQL